MARYGGFIGGKNAIYKNWSTMKTSSGPASSPTTQNFKYTDAKGVWDLNSTDQFSTTDPSAPWSHLGLPDLTYPSGTNTAQPTATTSAVIAIDMIFDSSSSGRVFKSGLSATGISLGFVAGGTINAAAFDGDPWQSTAQSWFSVDASAYYNTPGIWYLVADNTNKQIKLYFESTLIATGTTSVGGSTLWGSSNLTVGLTATNPSINVTGAFSGSLNDIKIWLAAAQLTP